MSHETSTHDVTAPYTRSLIKEAIYKQLFELAPVAEKGWRTRRSVTATAEPVYYDRDDNVGESEFRVEAAILEDCLWLAGHGPFFKAKTGGREVRLYTFDEDDYNNKLRASAVAGRLTVYAESKEPVVFGAIDPQQGMAILEDLQKVLAYVAENRSTS